MCDNCFTTEILKFKNQKHWTNFDLELTQKLGQEKLKKVRVDGRRIDGNEHFWYIYQCLTCGQEWKLEEPHDHGDGHFIKLSTLNNLATRQLSNRRLALLVIIVILILILIRFISW